MSRMSGDMHRFGVGAFVDANCDPGSLHNWTPPLKHFPQAIFPGALELLRSWTFSRGFPQLLPICLLNIVLAWTFSAGSGR